MFCNHILRSNFFFLECTWYYSTWLKNLIFPVHISKQIIQKASQKLSLLWKVARNFTNNQFLLQLNYTLMLNWHQTCVDQYQIAALKFPKATQMDVKRRLHKDNLYKMFCRALFSSGLAWVHSKLWRCSEIIH